MNKQSMKALIIGGTGFLGYHSALELIRRGHEVTVLALPPMPAEGLLPPEVAVILADIDAMPDGEVQKIFQKHDAVVYAAGADDRVTPPAPAYEFFYRANVASCERLFTIARKAGVKRGVLLGSYFAYFDRERPDMRLAQKHPYIRSRREQAARAIEAAGDDLVLVVLDLPYIFGAMPGRDPLWKPLVKYIASPFPFFCPRGGTIAVAVGHVAEAVAGALERGEPGGIYAVGEENLSWREMVSRLAVYTGRKKRFIPFPAILLRLSMRCLRVFHRLKGKEGGLEPLALTDIITSEMFFDPGPFREILGFGSGGLEDAFRDTVRASL